MLKLNVLDFQDMLTEVFVARGIIPATERVDYVLYERFRDENSVGILTRPSSESVGRVMPHWGVNRD